MLRDDSVPFWISGLVLLPMVCQKDLEGRVEMGGRVGYIEAPEAGRDGRRVELSRN